MAGFTTPNMNGVNKDTILTKIFVGGLPYQTTDESLSAFFEQFGSIDEAVVIIDRVTSKSKGYGFVTMADKESAERACMDPNPIIDGRKANVNLAYLGAKPRTFPYINGGGVVPVMAAGNPVIPGATGQTPQLPYGYGMPQMQYVLTPNGYVAMVPGSMSAPSPTLNQTAVQAVNATSTPPGIMTQQFTSAAATATESSNLEDSLSSNPDTISQQQQTAALQAQQLQKYAALGIYPATAAVNQIQGLSGLNAQQSAAVLQASQLPGLQAAGYGGVNQQAMLAAKYMSPTAASYYTYTAPQMIGRGIGQYQVQPVQDRIQ